MNWIQRAAEKIEAHVDENLGWAKGDEHISVAYEGTTGEIATLIEAEYSAEAAKVKELLEAAELICSMGKASEVFGNLHILRAALDALAPKENTVEETNK